MAKSKDARIGQCLRQKRLSKNMTKSELAKAAGLSFQQVIKFERGACRIMAPHLWNISLVLEISVDDLFVGLKKAPTKPKGPPAAPDEGVRDGTIATARTLCALQDEEVKEHFLRLIRAYTSKFEADRAISP